MSSTKRTTKVEQARGDSECQLQLTKDDKGWKLGLGKEGASRGGRGRIGKEKERARQE
jgi:hypothetical protein